MTWDTSSSTGSERLRASLWGVAALCFALGGRPAAADDAKPDPKAALEEQTARVTQLEAAVAKHAAEKAEEALAVDAWTALGLAREISEAGLKGRVVAVAGEILRGTHKESVQRPAIKALGTLGEAAGFPYLSPFFAPFAREATDRSFTLETLEASAKMKSDESVPYLLAIVENSADAGLAVAAIKALGGFGESKAREKILAGLVATVRKDRPSASYRWARGIDLPGPGSRYGTLAGEMNLALNRLTGQNVASPEDWFDLVEKYKADLAALWGGRPPAGAPPAEKASPEVTEKVALLEVALALHAGKKADEALEADVEKAVTLSAEIADPSLRGRLAVAVGALLEGPASEAIQRAAVKALGRIGDPKGFRFVRRFLAPWGGAEGNPLILEALDAAAKIKSDDSVTVLMALVQSSEPAVAVAAVRAFAGFGRNKATRERIVADLISAVRNRGSDTAHVRWTPPCIPEPEGTGPWSGVRGFDLLTPVMTTTLNAMTGRALPGATEWFALVDARGGDLSGLFLDK